MIKRIKSYFQNNSFKSLTREIKGYGYEYSLKKYLFSMLFLVSAICIAAYYLKIKAVLLTVVILYSILGFPLIVRAQFKHIHNNDRFEQLTTYCEHMILAFMETPKILSALKSTQNYSDERIKSVIQKAIDVIETSYFDVDAYLKAFRIIEDEFPNSRVASMHKFMLTVENEDSERYHNSLNTLYYDIHEWIKRTYQYQIELKRKKIEILAYMFVVLAICLFMTSTYTAIQDQINLYGNPVFQVLTLGFVLGCVTLYIGLEIKMHGQWLIDDMKSRNDQSIIKTIEDVQNYDFMASLHKKIAVAVVFAVFCVYFAYKANYDYFIISLLLGILIMFSSYFKNRANKKKIEQNLMQEFPVWLRDITLNLNNHTAVPAMKNTISTSPAVLQPFLKEFLDEVDKNPTSIEPYVQFLSEYKISDLSVAMNSLYSLRYLDYDETQSQINELVKRNQSMLETSENIRNKSSLSFINLFNIIPLALATVKMMGDVFIIIFLFFLKMGSVL